MKGFKTELGYNIQLTYDELNALYHALGNYSWFVNSFIGFASLGGYISDGESEILGLANRLSADMVKLCPKLYSDLRHAR